MRINQKGQLPRLTHRFTFGTPTFSPAPMSRSKYLNGDVKAYYGPGQPPDAGAPENYTPPADWPKAGTLLRVPQVAWLSLSVRDFDFNGYTNNTGTFYRTYACRVEDPGFLIWTVGDHKIPGNFDGSWGYTVFNETMDGLVFVFAFGHVNSNGESSYEYTPNPVGPPITVSAGGSGPTASYYVQLPNPYKVEYNRILGIYQQVKETIEAARPNRTWVEIIDPWLPNQLIDNRKYFKDEGFDDDVYFPMIAPKDQDTYFGTRFLHIYAGSPATSSSGPWVGVFGHFIDSIFANGYSYISRVTHPPDSDQLDRFASFAIRVYGLSVKLDKFPPYTPPSIPTPGHPNFSVSETHGEGPLLGGSFVTTSQEVPWSRYTEDADIASSLVTFAASVNTQINSVNASNETRDVSSNEWLKFMAETLGDRGVDCEWMGLSDQISAASLVNLIAEHFRFDPSTGDDLPDDE